MESSKTSTDTVRFLYDVRAVSGSHAEITVSIAGLSLALLLILPIFGGDSAFFQSSSKILPLLFFFTSLVFGILASFEYSVMSGDKRSEPIRVMAFLGPSIAFGISIPLLLLGFIYVVRGYLDGNETNHSIVSIMRSFSLLGLWASGILVSRTILEAISFTNNGPTWVRKLMKEHKAKIMLIMVGYTTIAALFPVMKMIINTTPVISILASNIYFYFLVLLGFLNVVYYVFAAMSSIKVSLLSTDRLAWVLLVGFTIFVIWTFVVFA